MKKFTLCEVVEQPMMLGSPIKKGDHVLFLGEISNMPGHVAIATKDGKVLFGYHEESFRKLKLEET